ncbi:MAG: cation diffusion facilitator family transporter [Bacillota bacterium]|nr:cation diffusion facilitator family transporter [Bacillota bacterium]
MAVETRQQTANKVAGISLTTNILLTIAKAAVGVLSGSTAVVADAAHSASDIAATAIVWVGLRLGGTPPDQTHHYGHAKFESVAAKVVALILVVTGAGLGVNAWRILHLGEYNTPLGLAIWVTLLSIVVKETLYRYVLGVGKRIGSTALEAEAWHHRSDAISSVAALLGVGGAYLGYPALDPIAGLAVSLLIIQMGAKLYVQSVRALIDEAPAEQVVNKIKQTARETGGVMAVNDVKARTVGPNILVDMKLCVNRFLTVEEGHKIGSCAKRNIQEAVPDVNNVLIHVNPCHHVRSRDETPDCTLCGEHSGLGSKEEEYATDTTGTRGGGSDW